MNTEKMDNDYRFYHRVSTLYGDSYVIQLINGSEIALSEKEFADFQASLNKGHLCESGLVDPEHVTCNSSECNYPCSKNE